MQVLLRFFMLGILFLEHYASAFNHCEGNILTNVVLDLPEKVYLPGWNRKRRSSYWTVSQDVENLQGTDDGCLCFKSTNEESYFSQFLSVEDTTGNGLSVDAVLSGVSYKKLSIEVYIRYKTGLLFKVMLSGSDATQNKITRFIPKYGVIITIAVFVVAGIGIKDPVCVCNLSLKLCNSPEPDMPVYVDSFITQRHIIPNYLSPIHKGVEEYLPVITIATQLTPERLENLERMVGRWRGPVSAAVLVMGNQVEQISTIVKSYYNSGVLSRHVTLHLVFEDSLNGNDGFLYPVNFLRNTALQYATSEYVFLLDADIIPGFCMSEALQWINHATPEPCLKCAFVAPLYLAENNLEVLPRNKSDLLDLLNSPGSPIGAYGTMSHAVVNFKKWESANETYKIQYRPDMEPYFITDSKAPFMNDVYSGYGRDKCAYSKDHHQAGYEFVVLPQAFIVDVKEDGMKNHPRIYTRSQGVKLSMFLSIDFHEFEASQSHLTFRDADDSGIKVDNRDSCHRSLHVQEQNCDHWTSLNSHLHNQDYSKDNQDYSKDNQDYSKDNQDYSKDNQDYYKDDFENTPEEEEEYFGSCQTLMPDELGFDSMSYFNSFEYESREDVIAERLIRQFQTGHVIVIPHMKGSALAGYLHFVHPDSVTVVSPKEGPLEYSEEGHYRSLTGMGDLSILLDNARSKNQGPSLIIIRTESIEGTFSQTIESSIRVLTNQDILVVLGKPKTLFDVLKVTTFCNTTNLEIFKLKVGILLKPKELEIKDIPEIPPTPQIDLKKCASNQRFKTDVILMTRNRPMQTLAFLQSLSYMATGVSKVWVQYKADDAPFISAYKNATYCVKDNLDVELVDDKANGFGKTLKKILQESSADFVILAVDEMVWLRPVDLNFVAWLLCNNKEIGSFQLRLGENIAVYNTIKGKDLRIFPVLDLDISLFYPLRMPYDFGYVNNVDGTMINTSVLLQDLSGWLDQTHHPGELESRWMVRKINTRARQWHLMYKQSRLVNNALTTDGRVIGRSLPAEGSYHLAKLMLEGKKQISVTDFISANAMHSSTHINRDVVYEDMKCNT